MDSPFAPWFPDYKSLRLPMMPKAANAFDEHFGFYGGRYEPKANDDMLLGPGWFRRRCWDYLLKFQQVPNYRSALHNVYFDYIENKHLNAVVGANGDQLFLGLFIGAYLHLSTFFDLLLSHPNVLPGIGEPKKQVRWFDKLETWSWSFAVDAARQSYEKAAGTMVVPAKGERAVYAGYLTMFAMDFMLFHEMGHWCNGHDRLVRLLNQEFNGIFEEEKFDEIPATVRLFLELNADSFAAMLMTTEWFHVSFGPTSIFKSAQQALQTWATAMMFVYILFGQQRQINVIKPTGIHPHIGLITEGHPHPMMRMMNTRLAAIQVASLFGKQAVVDKAWTDAFRDVQQICEMLQMPSTVWFADSETVMRTYQALSLEWSAWCIPKLGEASRIR